MNVVSAISAVLSIGFWASWGGFGRRTIAVGAPGTVVGERTVIREHDPIARQVSGGSHTVEGLSAPDRRS